MAGHRTWALVTNGVRARILRDLEDDGAADRPELVSKAPATHLRAVLSAKAGGPAARDHGHGPAPDPENHPLLRDMRDFARETLATLDRHRRARCMTRLALFAPPRMLEMLHSEIPDGLGDTVILERDLDLTALPEAELRAAVRAALGERSRA